MTYLEPRVADLLVSLRHRGWASETLVRDIIRDLRILTGHVSGEYLSQLADGYEARLREVTGDA